MMMEDWEDEDGEKEDVEDDDVEDDYVEEDDVDDDLSMMMSSVISKDEWRNSLKSFLSILFFCPWCSSWKFNWTGKPLFW